ncbi:hypothetical protein APT65_00095 [Trabzonvirus APT65]|uniref:Uncharacterized protein n=1 Tax=Aeromonas phage APT65 TaxID=2982914 RepID=A0A9E8GAR7_9CAUD|nr:hypothetical protein APT65_00095 [Aeromonas phage APT65]
MEKLSASVRHYDSKGNFIMKMRLVDFVDEVGFLKSLDLICKPITDRPVTWCNIMIRKNGKLISYKELYQAVS